MPDSEQTAKEAWQKRGLATVKREQLALNVTLKREPNACKEKRAHTTQPPEENLAACLLFCQVIIKKTGKAS